MLNKILNYLLMLYRFFWKVFVFICSAVVGLIMFVSMSILGLLGFSVFFLFLGFMVLSIIQAFGF